MEQAVSRARLRKHLSTLITLSQRGGGSTVYGWVNSVDVSVLVSKIIEKIALEVIRVEWDNGAERVKKLTAAGYDSNEVQKCCVDQILKK